MTSLRWAGPETPAARRCLQGMAAAEIVRNALGKGPRTRALLPPEMPTNG